MELQNKLQKMKLNEQIMQQIQGFNANILYHKHLLLKIHNMQERNN